jgi:hypothetical protein
VPKAAAPASEKTTAATTTQSQARPAPSTGDVSGRRNIYAAQVEDADDDDEEDE